MKLFDIGANLTDKMFSGVYNNKKKHEEDLNLVLNRAKDSGVKTLIITSGCLNDLIEAIEIINRTDIISLYTTAGIHPTRALMFETLKEIELKIEKERKNILAIGECGLDYDRFSFSKKEEQLKCFELHFKLAEKFCLPMFFHMRNAGADFIEIVKRNRKCFKKGVVHSFTGSETELKELLDLGLYIGINGCSLKTEEVLNSLLSIPLERIMFETDSPWCGIRKTHAGIKFLKSSEIRKESKKYSKDFLLKGRNEPCNIDYICKIYSRARGISTTFISEQIFRNTNEFFFN